MEGTRRRDPHRLAWTAGQMRDIDRAAIEALGGDGHALMARAGEAAFRAIAANHPEARTLGVVCGRGNNGGDGYVVARLARANGREAVVFAAAEPKSDDARRARREFIDGGGRVEACYAAPAMAACDLLVDGVLGIGLTRAPEGEALQAIEAMNAAAKPIVALDVPSGLDADSGHVPGACVEAVLTVTFIGLKRGLLTSAAPARTGRLVLEPLGVAAASFAGAGEGVAVLDREDLQEALRPRARDAHKGHFGHVLVVGGDLGYGGAARLAGEAALRAGAGLVSVATRAQHVAALLGARPELMVRGVERGEDLAPLLERAGVIAVGPGLGQSEWSRAMLDAVLGAGRPLVLDADALNLIAGSSRRLGDAVITPHPGEAARLLGSDTGAVQRDRYAAVRELARRHACVAVLKGAGTLVAGVDGGVAVCPVAEPALAAGGTGDVLTGAIASLRAQGLEAAAAARAGVIAHALAGQRAAHGRARGLLALDVAAALPDVLPP